SATGGAFLAMPCTILGVAASRPPPCSRAHAIIAWTRPRVSCPGDFLKSMQGNTWGQQPSSVLVAAHELEEAAGVALARLILIEEGKLALLELVEKLLPADLLQAVLAAEAFEVAAQAAPVALARRVLDVGGARHARLHALADGLVVCGRPGSAAAVVPPVRAASRRTPARGRAPPPFYAPGESGDQERS